MAASAVALSSKTIAPRAVVARSPKSFRPVRAARAAVVVKASAKAQTALSAAVVTSVATMMASPLAAEAAVTPSLKNFFLSLVAGATVLGGIALAITAVSNFDPVRRS